eukprot:scaffold138117_cov65-Attheya_sp.AAC.2
MICSSSLSDASLIHYMKSIFDLITVVPEEVIKMSEKELERILHKMGQSSMNAASVVAYEAFGISRIPVDTHVLKFAKYFGWCGDNALPYQCQEDIEGWMPEIYWYLVNSTIGSFCQLATSNQALLYSEMDRMRMGLINPKFDMVHFLKEYVCVGILSIQGRREVVIGSTTTK